MADELSYGDIVECMLTPRAEYRGRMCRPEFLAAAGERLTLEVLWKQGDDDPYPGEWALGRHGALIHGRAWISSGDVRLLDSHEMPIGNENGYSLPENAADYPSSVDWLKAITSKKE